MAEEPKQCEKSFRTICGLSETHATKMLHAIRDQYMGAVQVLTHKKGWLRWLVEGGAVVGGAAYLSTHPESLAELQRNLEPVTEKLQEALVPVTERLQQTLASVKERLQKTPAPVTQAPPNIHKLQQQMRNREFNSDID